MLEVKNLSVAYGGLRALSDVTLSVAAGRFVTIVGPNGAGKSTLCKTICGVVSPVSGAITFGGEDLLSRQEHPAAEPHHHVGDEHTAQGEAAQRVQERQSLAGIHGTGLGAGS